MMMNLPKSGTVCMLLQAVRCCRLPLLLLLLLLVLLLLRQSVCCRSTAQLRVGCW
jgi:hypothetical protein